MKSNYEDILHLPHHSSSTRQRMSAHDRGAQFAPFAALTGYDDAIGEMRRVTDRDFILAADGEALLDEKLRALASCLPARVAVTCFVPDPKKSGGSYQKFSGGVKKLDAHREMLILTDGTEITFGRIYGLEWEQEGT